jgi:hypothetical protein
MEMGTWACFLVIQLAEASQGIIDKFIAKIANILKEKNNVIPYS